MKLKRAEDHSKDKEHSEPKIIRANSELCPCQEHAPASLLLLLSHFTHVLLCATPEMAAHKAPPSLGFSRQEHWSGLPFPSPMQGSEKGK